MSAERPTETVTVGRFLAYDEGCYECGEPSGVLGFYGSRSEAEAAVEAAIERQEQGWRGQHMMHVIDLAQPTMSEWADSSLTVDGEALRPELPA